MAGIEDIVRKIVREEVRAALAEWVQALPEQEAKAGGELLSVPSAAEVLGVAESTLRNWRADRKDPPAVRVGRLVKYRRGDLEEWVAAQR